MNKKHQKEFTEHAKPLIKWLNENANPHCKIIITVDSAEVVSGEHAFFTEEFIVD